VPLRERLLDDTGQIHLAASPAVSHKGRGLFINQVAYQDLSFDNQQSAIDNHQSSIMIQRPVSRGKPKPRPNAVVDCSIAGGSESIHKGAGYALSFALSRLIFGVEGAVKQDVVVRPGGKPLQLFVIKFDTFVTCSKHADQRCGPGPKEIGLSYRLAVGQPKVSLAGRGTPLGVLDAVRQFQIGDREGYGFAFFLRLRESAGQDHIPLRALLPMTSDAMPVENGLHEKRIAEWS
jgi:hypothetical protein